MKVELLQDAELTFPHRYVSAASTRGTSRTEYPLNAGGRPRTAERARKPPRTGVGKKKERNRDGTCARGRKLWKRRRGEQPGHRGASEPQRRARRPVCGSQSSGRTAQSVLPRCTPQPEARVRRCRWGLGAGTRASEVGPREGTWVGCAEAARAGWHLVQPHLRVWAEEAWAALEARRDCLGGARRKGWDPDCSLFPCARTRRGQDAACTGSGSGREPPPLPSHAPRAGLGLHSHPEPQDWAPATTSAHPRSRR